MNRGSLFHGKDQRLKQKGFLNKRELSKKQILGKEGRSTKSRRTKEGKLNISLAINEALNDLKNSQEYDNLETELVPPSPIKNQFVDETEPVSPIKEKQRRSSFDVTHTKSPIILPVVAEEIIEPISLSPPKRSDSEVHPTEEELLDETDTIIYMLTNKSSHLKIPTKSILSAKQEQEFQSMIHTLVSTRRSLYESSDQNIIQYYFTNYEVAHLVNTLRYESPYGTSCTCYLLELLCKFDIEYVHQVTKYIAEFVWQFVLDERDLPIQADDDYKTIQKQLGSIHRYVNFFQFLVESLRSDVAMNPPTSQEIMEMYLDQASALIHIVECLICTRNAVEKYTEILSSLTLCLFSISPQEIESFYQFLLRHWPRGYSEKTIGLIQFLENLLSSSPPLYLTPFLKEVVHRIFKKVCQELLGSQVEISKRCAYFLQNYYLRSNYIAVDQAIVMTVKKALEKGMEHWNEIIAMICEKAIDLILDDI